MSQQAHAIRARVLLQVAIDSLYKAEGELVSMRGHLNDDSRDMYDVRQRAEAMIDRLGRWADKPDVTP